MAEYTDNYGLILPDGTDRYDREHQNDNMEIIDENLKRVDDKSESVGQELAEFKLDYVQQRQQVNLKVAKVEKDLTDYQKTLSQVNVNQEAKQKVTGYSPLSLPKNAANGQVSASVKGLTATNLIKNGDFSDGTAEWTTQNGNITVTNGVLHFRALNPFARLFNRFSIIAGNKYYLKHKNLQIDKPENKNTLVITTGMDASQVVEVFTTDNTDEKLGDYSLIFEPTENANGIRYNFGTYNTDTDETTYTLESMLCVNLTQTFGAGNEPTKEECDQIFSNYFDGTKSTVGAMRMKSVGKNLFDGKIYKEGINYNTGEFLPSTNKAVRSGFIRVAPNTDYRISGLSNVSNSFVAFYDRNKNYISRTISSAVTGRTFTTPSNCMYIAFNQFVGTITQDEMATKLANEVQIEKGTTGSDYEAYRESNAYVIAKDSTTGEMLQLRSVPSGAKDEVRVSEGKLIKRVSNGVVINQSTSGDLNKTYINVDVIRILKSNFENVLTDGTDTNGNRFTITGFSPRMGGEFDSINNVGKISETATYFYMFVEKNKYSSYDEAMQLLQPLTLTYQLAEPEEIPIQVSGSLTSHPNGTVFIEPIVADAGVYTDKIEVLHQDLPMKVIEKVSKVDFVTGLETELDIEDIAIAEDKLSFIHPELIDGDIVFFEYEYDVESTQGETQIEYYDSRYTIKDSVTDKFYKWNVTVADGVPSIELVEV